MLFTGVICDRCGESKNFNDIYAKKYITKWLREAGWSVGKETLCQSCARQKKEERK